MPTSDPPERGLRISMLGTRGVPAAYGGFETAIDEIGRRLVQQGHRVVVYCRGNANAPRRHRGMRLVHLPAMRSKVLETLSHTFLSVLHVLVNRPPDVAFVFNAANAPFLPLLKLRRIPVVVHVDGLEWKRGKWGRLGRLYYRLAERLSVLWADALIADAQGIADYYRDRFGAPTELLTYGAPIIRDKPDDLISALGLTTKAFHLVVARFEPENHVHVVLDGYTSSAAALPLVVVGSAPYAAEYTDGIAAVAEADDRVRLLGGVWDQELLDQLYAHALTYVHGHSVGGTNPSLLRAMGAGTAVIAWDVDFNREVLAGSGEYFSDSDSVRRAIEAAEADPTARSVIGRALRAHAEREYDWSSVAAGYGELARRMSR